MTGPSGVPATPLPAAAPRGGLASAEIVELAELLSIDIGLAPFGIADLQLALEVEQELASGYVDYGGGQREYGEHELLTLGMTAVANLQAQPDYYRQLTRAHAPGDPVPWLWTHADMGAD